MKPHLLTLLTLSPLTACVGVSSYPAPINNPLAGINGTNARGGINVSQPVPTAPTRVVQNTSAYSPVYAQQPVIATPRTITVQPVQQQAVALQPLPITRPVAVQPVITTPQPLLPQPVTVVQPVVVQRPNLPQPVAVNTPITAMPSTQTEALQQLAIQNMQLQQQVVFLNQRIAQLEPTTQPPAPVQKRQPSRPVVNTTKKRPAPVASKPTPRRPAPTVVPTTYSIPATTMPDPTKEKLKIAEAQFRRGEYQNVLHTLRGAENGGNGSVDARHSMYLLLKTNLRLNHCQSVINIGQRLASLYANSPEAPEALYTVGECQRGIQQQDIARDTWRKLISTYPNSAAARRARVLLRSA